MSYLGAEDLILTVPNPAAIGPQADTIVIDNITAQDITVTNLAILGPIAFGGIVLETNINGAGNTATARADTGLGNANLALVPENAGALVAAIPDNTATGGNARGANAVDFQMTRTIASRVASGATAGILCGQENTASGISSAVLCGQNNTAIGQNAAVTAGNINVASNIGAVVCGGTNNVASGQYTGIVCGNSNAVSGDTSAVLAGITNGVSGQRSVIVSGNASFVAGNSSTAMGNGNFISGNDSTAIGNFINCTSNNNVILSTGSQAAPSRGDHYVQLEGRTIEFNPRQVIGDWFTGRFVTRNNLDQIVYIRQHGQVVTTVDAGVVSFMQTALDLSTSYNVTVSGVLVRSSGLTTTVNFRTWVKCDGAGTVTTNADNPITRYTAVWNGPFSGPTDEIPAAQLAFAIVSGGLQTVQINFAANPGSGVDAVKFTCRMDMEAISWNF